MNADFSLLHATQQCSKLQPALGCPVRRLLEHLQQADQDGQAYSWSLAHAQGHFKFTEKIPGTERHLISEELIAFLSWIIYVAAYKTSTGLANEVCTIQRSRI